MGLFNKKNNDRYAKINIEFDGSKIRQEPAVVEGDEKTIVAVIGSLIKNLIEQGIDKKLFKSAIEYGFNENKNTHKNITVKEIHIDENKAKDFEKLINKLMED